MAGHCTRSRGERNPRLMSALLGFRRGVAGSSSEASVDWGRPGPTSTAPVRGSQTSSLARGRRGPLDVVGAPRSATTPDPSLPRSAVQQHHPPPRRGCWRVGGGSPLGSVPANFNCAGEGGGGSGRRSRTSSFAADGGSLDVLRPLRPKRRVRAGFGRHLDVVGAIGPKRRARAQYRRELDVLVAPRSAATPDPFLPSKRSSTTPQATNPTLLAGERAVRGRPHPRNPPASNGGIGRVAGALTAWRPGLQSAAVRAGGRAVPAAPTPSHPPASNGGIEGGQVAGALTAWRPGLQWRQ